LGKIKYIGNWVVASGTAFTLIYGAAVVGNYGLIVIFAASAWLVNVGREITKDIEDIGADKGMKRSLPMIVGKNISKYMVFYAYAAGVFLSLWIFAAGIVTSQIYFILIALSAVVLGYCMLLIAQGKINASQRLSKLAMLIALIAYLSTIIK
jgi:4-hydroxybenzoate polyprenyltransferase